MDSKPVALPPAINSVRCADVAFQMTVIYHGEELTATAGDDRSPNVPYQNPDIAEIVSKHHEDSAHKNSS